MDWNVVQAPELLRRLTQRLGMRQAHVAPTLNEGIQAVVILDDISRPETVGGLNSGRPRVVMAAARIGAMVATVDTYLLYRNTSQDERHRIRFMRIATSTPVRYLLGWQDGVLGALAGNAAVPLTRTTVADSKFSDGSAVMNNGSGGAGVATFFYQSQLYDFTIQTNAPIGFDPGLVIPPGSGIILQNAPQAGVVGATADWNLVVEIQ